MIYRNKIPPNTKFVNDCLKAIEKKMDQEIIQSHADGRTTAFIMVDGYPPSVLAKLPELVKRYISAGWDATLDTNDYLSVRLK